MIDSMMEQERGPLPPNPPPAVGWASGPLGRVQAAAREIGRLTAVQARELAAFAATRPSSVDRQSGEKGCMSAERRAARPEVLAEVSEWATQELSIALSISSKAAENLLTRSLTLVHRLPGTLAALESGVLDTGHLWTLLENVAPVMDRVVRERLERDLLGWVAGRQVTTPAQLGAKVRREVLARNVRSAARDLETALRRRGVRLRSDRTEGMALLEVLLTVPEARALLDALGRYADALDDTECEGPLRTRAQKMADCLMDLVLRHGEQDLPPVQAQLTLIAPVATMAGGDAPGEIDNEPVPAEMVRALAQGFGLLPAPPRTASPVMPHMSAIRSTASTSSRASTRTRWPPPTRPGGPKSRRERCVASGAGTRIRRWKNGSGIGPRRPNGSPVTANTTRCSAIPTSWCPCLARPHQGRSRRSTEPPSTP